MAGKYRGTASRFGRCTTDTKWIERSNWLRAVHGVTLLHGIDPSCQTLWTWPLLHGHNSCSRRPITRHGFKQSQASAKKLKPSSAAMAAKYRATASRFGCCTTDTKWIERSNWLRAVHGVTLLHSIDPSCQTLWTWPLLHGHNSCSRRPAHYSRATAGQAHLRLHLTCDCKTSRTTAGNAESLATADTASR